MPYFTHTQGTLSIQPSSYKQVNPNIESEETERYIVVSLWDYPTVNEKKGDIVINKVILTEEKSITIDFPFKSIRRSIVTPLKSLLILFTLY